MFEKTENKQKRGRGWPIFFKKNWSLSKLKIAAFDVSFNVLYYLDPRLRIIPNAESPTPIYLNGNNMYCTLVTFTFNMYIICTSYIHHMYIFTFNMYILKIYGLLPIKAEQQALQYFLIPEWSPERFCWTSRWQLDGGSSGRCCRWRPRRCRRPRWKGNRQARFPNCDETVTYF